MHAMSTTDGRPVDNRTQRMRRRILPRRHLGEMRGSGARTKTRTELVQISEVRRAAPSWSVAVTRLARRAVVVVAATAGSAGVEAQLDQAS